MFANICHQALFYPRGLFDRHRYNAKYRILADHAFNLQCYGDGSVYFSYLPILIALYNDAGGKSFNAFDPDFERDRAALVRASFPWYSVFHLHAQDEPVSLEASSAKHNSEALRLMLPSALLPDLLSAWPDALAALLLFGLVYLLIYRRIIDSIFDPLFLQAIFSAFGGAAVLFMYSENIIGPRYFYSYVNTQAAFLLGLSIFGALPRRVRFPPQAVGAVAKSDSAVAATLFVLASITYLVAQTLSYSIGGIPLLTTSRLAFYQSDSGFGLVSRIIYATQLVTIYLMLDRLAHWRTQSALSKLYVVFILINILVHGVLSGSKATFLNICFLAYFYALFQQRARGQPTSSLLARLQYGFLAMAVLAAIGVGALQSGTSDEPTSVVGAMIARLVLSGDAFVLAYPNDVIEHMAWHNPLLVIFQDAIGVFRFVRWEELPTTLGIELYGYHVPTLDVVGPNPRHNVFGVVYFGVIWAVLYSFFIGALLGLARSRLFHLLRPTLLGGLVYALIVLPLSGIEADIALVVGYLDNILLVLPPLLVMSVIIAYAVRALPAPTAVRSGVIG